MKAAVDSTQAPPRCSECGADEYSCDIKRGLSGRRCCEDCTHEPSGDRP